MELDRRTILVTGGSSGLGAACVRHLVEAGANVVNADLAAPPAALPDNLALRVIHVRTDVTSEADVRGAVEAAEHTFGPVRGAVLCAGVLHAELILGRDGPASLEAFRRSIEINLVGTFNVLRLAAQAIARQTPDADGERGVLVTTASIAAFEAQMGQAAYAASKGGVAAMTLPLARDLARHGIRVVSIAPGVFDTPMMQAAPEKVRQSLLDQTPFPRRFGRPEEFAALVRHVFENRMFNGCVLRLDAGLRMGPR